MKVLQAIILMHFPVLGILRISIFLHVRNDRFKGQLTFSKHEFEKIVFGTNNTQTESLGRI